MLSRPMTKRQFITVTQAAQRAGVTRQAIHDAIEAGKFPGAYKATPEANSPYLIPEDEFQDWLKKRGQPMEG